MSHITTSQFADRFVALILAGRELPKKQLDRHILLIISILKIEPDRPYTEKEINKQLQLWVIHFGRTFSLDHVTLRRFSSTRRSWPAMRLAEPINSLPRDCLTLSTSPSANWIWRGWWPRPGRRANSESSNI